MAKFLSYALATCCFAASVGCLGLWWRSVGIEDRVWGPSFRQGEKVTFRSKKGSVQIASIPTTSKWPQYKVDWHAFSKPIQTIDDAGDRLQVPRKRIRVYSRGFVFPLWYPALIFALAGVVALRLGRRFTLRSAIVATTVVAGLLGMAVEL